MALLARRFAPRLASPVLPGPAGHCPDALLMVRKRRHTLPSRQIPQFDRAIVAPCDNLWVSTVGFDASHRPVVTGEHVDLVLGTHVPDPTDGVAPARH